MIIHALRPPMGRVGRRRVRLCALSLTVGLLAACGDSDSTSDNAAGTSTTASEGTEATDPDSTAAAEDGDQATSTTSTTEADGSDATDGTDGNDEQDIERLRGIVDATVARNSARFSLDVTQTLPVVGPNQASMRRTGLFDDQTQIGTGTQLFVGQAGALTDLPGYAGEELEYRLVDGTYWLLNPVADPPTWVGYDLGEFDQLTEGDPTVSINGDLYLDTVAEAVSSITEVVVFDDGSEGWTVTVTADDLLPLVVTAGVQQRLVADGLEATDIEADVSLAVDPEGMVVGLIADLNEWWQAVIDQTAETGSTPVGMVLQFQIGDFDAPVDTNSPCVDPEELVEPDAPTALICDG